MTNATVVVIEDEPALLHAYSRILRNEGLHVISTLNGSGIEQLLMNENVDAVLTDINLPKETGLDLLQKIRKLDVDMPVLLMTGDPSLGSAMHAIEDGAMKYLVKPINKKTLQSSVAAAVRLHQMAKLKKEALAYSYDLRRQLGNEASLELKFNHALESLYMVYQPIIIWSERRIFGYEALVRSEEKFMSDPGSLFKVAEHLGRIHDLGQVIRNQVALTLVNNPITEDVLVNLHTFDLEDPTLFEASSPLSNRARQIILEITERASLDDVKDPHFCAERLRKLGFRLAIDDLGAGYAGLSSFAQINPNVVKLDMGLIRGIHLDPVKQKVVRSMLDLCRQLGITVISEGVETSDEKNSLIEIGCDVFQGFLFSRPTRDFFRVNLDLGRV